MFAKFHPRRRLNSFARPIFAPRLQCVLPPPNLSGRFRASWEKDLNPLASHSPYTLPSSVSRKSFICHSLTKTAGVCTNNSHSGTLFRCALTNLPSIPFPCSALCVLCDRRLPRPRRGAKSFFFFQLSTFDFNFRAQLAYPLCFHTLAHSLARRKTQLFDFQAIPHSLPKNTRGWGGFWNCPSDFSFPTCLHVLC